MTNVISLDSRKASHTAAQTAIATMPAPGTIERHQAIENALSMALFYFRQNEEPRNIQAATVKAVRAAAMLKQACAGAAFTDGGHEP